MLVATVAGPSGLDTVAVWGHTEARWAAAVMAAA